MKYLVIGNGARESAILWKLHQDEPEAKLYCFPGNGGIREIAEIVELKSGDWNELAGFAKEQAIDLTIVGPEQYLVEGVVDCFLKEGLAIIGPNKATAELEGSKAFAKEFMKKYQIPTADYETYDSAEQAFAALAHWKYPFVIKADGLAAGKGVLIIQNREEAELGLKQIMEDKKFGEAGNKVVFEEFLEGTEASLICLVDGKSIVPMESARDYKRALDGDEGLNTGGMGCFSPNPILTQAIQSEIAQRILQPMIQGIQTEKMYFRGILFIGLMLTKEGVKVLEFNVRFGDPETEVLMPRLQSKLADVLWAVYEQKLSEIRLEWKREACVGVVLAAKGYPESYEKGKVISVPAEFRHEMLFYGGTTRNEKEELVTNGGRVMVCAGLGTTTEEARQRAYQLAERISFDGKWYRRDIAEGIH